MDYGAMPMHFLAEGDDPPVIMIPEPVDNEDAAGVLPQVKIKRNYLCSHPDPKSPAARCMYFTQNPRSYLLHLRHVHCERMRIYECTQCTYASRHSQKMNRHTSMVHDPDRPERRRPGPAPRLREEYYADFVTELHKRRYRKAARRRKRALDKAMGLVLVKTPPPRVAPTATVTQQDSDSDSGDRLVINSEEEDQDPPQEEDEEEDEEEEEEKQQAGPSWQPEEDDIEEKLAAAAREIRMEMDPLTKQYKCSSCDFTSRTPSLVARHEGVVHLKKRFYRCSKCTYVTHLRSRYTKHFKYHMMPLIKCGECDFRTPYKWNLDRHIKNHGGRGRYTCRACSFSSNIRQSLTVHEMNHHHPPVCGPGELRRPHKRRQNKVGATDSGGAAAAAGSAAAAAAAGSRLKQESDMLRMEWEENELIQSSRSTGLGAAASASASSSSSSSVGGRGPDVAAGSSPSSRQFPTRELRCSLCDYRTPNFADMSRHMSSAHNSGKVARSPPTLTPAPPAKRVAKPLPNLIPIGLPRLAPKPELPDPPPAPANGESPSETTKKKNSFFDQLRLYPGNPSDPGTLVCVHCGHEAKCMSELVRHDKLHRGRALGTSTRCQHCRHRCKTSADLTLHLQTCSKAAAAAGASPRPDSTEAPLPCLRPETDAALSRKVLLSTLLPEEDNTRMTTDSEGTMEGEFGGADTEDSLDGHGEEEDEDPADVVVPTADPSLLGVETAPGYGLVTTQAEYDARAAKENVVTSNINVKKTFKCPHCPFWAAIASRFHVHMVGHLNKKPFACSVCKYRSNWRWDITKHIRIKESKDPLHSQAKTLMTDETGRRNYSKYNKNMLWLRVVEPSAELMKAVVMNADKTGMNTNLVKTEGTPVLSAPPKLTRAPAPRPAAQTRPTAPGTLLRPPPPLQAGAPQPAHVLILPNGLGLGQAGGQQQSQALKRPADSPIPNVGSDPKKPNTEIKKTVWRCKQCHFRDGDRQVVLTHVKGHYRQQQEAAMAKHKSTSVQSSAEQPQSVLKNVPLRCDTCPFISLSEAVMKAHVNCHKERDDVLFKCYCCPFYVSSKEELVQHMTVHRQSPKAESHSQASDKVSPVKNNFTSSPQNSSESRSSLSKNDALGNQIKVKEEINSELDIPFDNNEDAQSYDHPLGPPLLDYNNLNEAPLCWVFREKKLQKMMRCRYCPHVNLRKSNMLEHEKMHWKRSATSTSEATEASSQYSPYPCPDCSYLCNNAGVLSSHMKVHLPSYPQVYGFHKPYKNDLLQMKELSEQYKLQLKATSPQKSSSKEKKEKVAIGNENKLCGINVMSLLDPNQSLTDAVLAMKKKFNLELDGEPFAEPVEDSAESPCSALKPLNDETDLTASDVPEEKQLHFCFHCPARFLFRKELGIHSRFHNLHLVHKCDSCSYTARQRSHLQAHLKVHTEDYQERTDTLLKMYKVHKDFPNPRIVCVAKKGVSGGTVCIVVNACKPKASEESSPASTSKVFCPKCPAAFFKLDAMHSHLALHGSNNFHKCVFCDYAVKTSSNLIKHMETHGCHPKAAKKIIEGMKDVPGSLQSNTLITQNGSSTGQSSDGKQESCSSDGVDDNNDNDPVCLNGGVPSTKKNNAEEGVKLEEKNDPKEVIKEEDKSVAEDKENNHSEQHTLPSKSQSTSFAMGSPEFVYPTYSRNGRVKAKRYKCHKCPSAFEKRDQYLIHLSLHGSKQRYTCSRCDYSVKYYANHVQHIRKHQTSDDARTSNKDSPNASEGEEFIPEDSENIPATSTSPTSPSRSGKTTGGKGEKLSVADKQAMMVLQQRRAKGAAISREVLDKNYWCSHCPYSSPRRDQVESHMRRHFLVSGVRNAFACDHCDYSVPNKHFMRDHSKLHFDVSKAPRPDAYMICDRLELWASSGFMGKSKAKGRVLIFQDKGSNVLSDRFMPPLSSEVDEDNIEIENRVCINLKTLEVEGFNDTGSKDNSVGDAESNFEEEKESDVKDNKPGSLDEECNKDAVETSSNVSTSSGNDSIPPPCSPGSSSVENCDGKSS